MILASRRTQRQGGDDGEKYNFGITCIDVPLWKKINRRNFLSELFTSCIVLGLTKCFQHQTFISPQSKSIHKVERLDQHLFNGVTNMFTSAFTQGRKVSKGAKIYTKEL